MLDEYFFKDSLNQNLMVEGILTKDANDTIRFS
jgi:hypothetical protein